MSKLIVLAGLPGTGKTTLARRLSLKFNCFYLRIDCIEAPFVKVNSKSGQKGEGYEALINLALENLSLGHNVIIDTVNPLHITRKMFNALSERTKAETIQFELKIKDTFLHKTRVENRKSDIDGLKIPTWNDVMAREYEEWDTNIDGKNYEIWMDDMEDAFDRCSKVISKEFDT